MIKRVNFTGRRRIPRERVDIEVLDGNPRTIRALIDLGGTQFPSDASVVLEATCAGPNSIRRFEFGQLSNVQAPPDCSLLDLEGENVFFTLKVIDRSELVGRLLGMAEHIRPARVGKQTTTGRQGILPIDEIDLGSELWQLEFKDHGVTLHVNKQVPGLKERARTDPLFFAVVYPAIVRCILQRAIDDGVTADDDDDDRWSVQWLRFGKHLHPAKQSAPNPDSQDECEEWIDEVAGAFCEAHQFKDRFLGALSREGGDL